ncbi:MAG: DegT/DnrJ/EryC1/StrS family aminotransferase, partial [Mycobacterium sp.]|uniref:DegT/DnrJ/EryC1/StrS family aminotransferase n=1 Tax=Mycobacterium sp. TaxID=1785 RepID=UPI003C356CF9
RTVWSGNVTRHPMMRGVEYRVPADGLPNADEVFARGMSLGMSHGMSDEELNHVVKSVHEFAGRFAPAS